MARIVIDLHTDSNTSHASLFQDLTAKWEEVDTPANFPDGGQNNPGVYTLTNDLVFRGKFSTAQLIEHATYLYPDLSYTPDGSTEAQVIYSIVTTRRPGETFKFLLDGSYDHQHRYRFKPDNTVGVAPPTITLVRVRPNTNPVTQKISWTAPTISLLFRTINYSQAGRIQGYKYSYDWEMPYPSDTDDLATFNTWKAEHHADHASNTSLRLIIDFDPEHFSEDMSPVADAPTPVAPNFVNPGLKAGAEGGGLPVGDLWLNYGTGMGWREDDRKFMNAVPVAIVEPVPDPEQIPEGMPALISPETMAGLLGLVGVADPLSAKVIAEIEYILSTRPLFARLKPVLGIAGLALMLAFIPDQVRPATGFTEPGEDDDDDDDPEPPEEGSFLEVFKSLDKERMMPVIILMLAEAIAGRENIYVGA